MKNRKIRSKNMSQRKIVRYIPWLLLLLGTDAFGALLLWLADVRAFWALSGALLLATVLFFCILCGVLLLGERNREKAFREFLDTPDEYHEEILLEAVSPAWWESLRLLGRTLREKESACMGLLAQMEDYEEYVEAWAHETKMPLSLLTLLLDNRREELPDTVVFKLDYIRNNLQEYIDQMLFYARLKGAGKDYLFESISIGSCILEVLEEYQPLLEEKGFGVRAAVLKEYTADGECSRKKIDFDKENCLDGRDFPEDGEKFNTALWKELREEYVYTDRRGLRFLLQQLVSNAIKYSRRESEKTLTKGPVLWFVFRRTETSCLLTVGDNGKGVPDWDLPYIFEKGFTGDSGQDRKKATGMGLYLAREIAGDLGLTLEARSGQGKGFEMDISFPLV